MLWSSFEHLKPLKLENKYMIDKLLTILCWSVLAAHAHAQTNLVTNGSFELGNTSGTKPASGGSILNTTPSGWVTTAANRIDLLSSGFAGGVASSGTTWVDMIGGGSPYVGPVTMVQTLTLAAGTYDFSFDYNGWGGNGAGTTLNYNIGTLLSGSVDATGMKIYTGTAWSTLATTFTVTTAGSYALTFKVPSGSISGPMLDNVVVSASTVPEPTTASLALLGIGSLLVRRRVRR